MRLAVIETKGVTFEKNITPEDLAENVEQLLDPTDAVVMDIDVYNL